MDENIGVMSRWEVMPSGCNGLYQIILRVCVWSTRLQPWQRVIRGGGGALSSVSFWLEPRPCKRHAKCVAVARYHIIDSLTPLPYLSTLPRFSFGVIFAGNCNMAR